MIRFKLKYRFWGTSLEGTRQVFCGSDDTEILTKRGWLHHSELQEDDQTLGLDPVTKVITWQPILSVHRFNYDGGLVRWRNSHGFDALTTPNHRWLTVHRDRDGYSHWDAPGRFMTTEELSGGNKQIITGGGEPQCFASFPTFTDELVELIGWAVTEGHYQKPSARTGVVIAQSEVANPEKTERIRRLVKYFADQGATATEMDTHRSGKYIGCRDFYFGKGIGEHIRRLAPDKRLTPEFLCALTLPQAHLLYETLLDGDGHRTVLRSHDGYIRTVQTENFIQKDVRDVQNMSLVDDFQMLTAMLGRRSAAKYHSRHPNIVNTVVYARPVTTARHLNDDRVPYKGIVWCPRTPSSTWLARRNGCTYWTGNTFVELITDTGIEEFVNDELIDSRPNPLGTIPVVHIPNYPISGSPWGLSDIADVTSLNREYNEKATDISDIINYAAAPVTVITGAKPNQLERGARKIWGLPKDANVFNLEMGTNLSGPMNYMAMLKTAMHEMTGVPESALGQLQPISNTSGVAIALQYQPLMQKRSQKLIQYGRGLERVNELILLTLALKDPQSLVYNPTMDTPLKPGQLSQLDPNDPITYQSEAYFPPPLPVDQLIALNEIQAKMALGLESKRGAFRDLGFEFPDEKMQEIFAELVEDAKDQGALDLLKSQIMAAVAMMTGVMPGTAGPNVASAGGPGVNSASNPQGPLPGVNQMGGKPSQQIITDIVAQAMGTRNPQRRNPDQIGEDNE